MGLLGAYMMVDENTLTYLTKLGNEGLHEKINELEETNELYTIDKLWDGLHFLLTNVTASSPIENNKLSEAIVGIHVFDTVEAYFIACIENNELSEIIDALEDVSIEELEKEFNPEIFDKKDIYPDIWESSRKDELFEELLNEYNDLLAFYKKALEMNLHIIFSVF